MWRWWRGRRARAALYAAYRRAEEADREGRETVARLIEAWSDDPASDVDRRELPGRSWSSELTRPLPWVDSRPFMTPAAWRRAAHAERARRQTWD